MSVYRNELYKDRKSIPDHPAYAYPSKEAAPDSHHDYPLMHGGSGRKINSAHHDRPAYEFDEDDDRENVPKAGPPREPDYIDGLGSENVPEDGPLHEFEENDGHKSKNVRHKPISYQDEPENDRYRRRRPEPCYYPLPQPIFYQYPLPVPFIPYPGPCTQNAFPPFPAPEDAGMQPPRPPFPCQPPLCPPCPCQWDGFGNKPISCPPSPCPPPPFKEDGLGFRPPEAYGYFSSDTRGGPVKSGLIILTFADAVNKGVQLLPQDNTKIRVSASGLYRIVYSVDAMAAPGTALGLLQNSHVIPFTVVPIRNDVTVKEVFLPLMKNDTLSLELTGPATLAEGQNASVLIQLIASE